MLVLTRRKDNRIRIGDDIVLLIVDVADRQVRFGIDAPGNTIVLRDELYQEIVTENNEAKQGVAPSTSISDRLSSLIPTYDKKIKRVLKNFKRGNRFFYEHVGKIRYKDSQVLQVSGVLGNVSQTQHLLIPIFETSFFWLLNLEEPENSLLLVKPTSFYTNYDFKITKNDLEFLEASSPSELLLLSTVNITDETVTSINLKAPIAFNQEHGIGKQLIDFENIHDVKSVI